MRNKPHFNPIKIGLVSLLIFTYFFSFLLRFCWKREKWTIIFTLHSSIFVCWCNHPKKWILTVSEHSYSLLWPVHFSRVVFFFSAFTCFLSAIFNTFYFSQKYTIYNIFSFMVSKFWDTSLQIDQRSSYELMIVHAKYLEHVSSADRRI